MPTHSQHLHPALTDETATSGRKALTIAIVVAVLVLLLALGIAGWLALSAQPAQALPVHQSHW